MKLNYRQQLILTVGIILVGNALNMLVHHWAFSSAAKILCGLIWVVHPVMPGSVAPSQRDLNIIRAAGVILILWGLFSRLYLY